MSVDISGRTGARAPRRSDGCCFCGAAGQLVALDVVDPAWSRRFGGVPAVALDHGWYWSSRGGRVPAQRLCTTKSFAPTVRAACDFCVHGWISDVRARVEGVLLPVAEAGPAAAQDLPAHWTALVRWARLTALLAELIDGMPRASTAAQCDAVRRGGAPDPPIDCWMFTTLQRLPARLHLSQVPLPGEGEGTGDSLVQVVTLDLARLTVVVAVPSDAQAVDVVRRSVPVGDGVLTGDRLEDAGHRLVDLSRAAHPHADAVRRLCTASRG